MGVAVLKHYNKKRCCVLNISDDKKLIEKTRAEILLSIKITA